MRYTRILGKRIGLYRRSTLWMGGDHLLAVESSGYTEQYRRLYFKDIQAVIIRETSRKRDLGILFASLAFLSALPALIQLDALASPLSFMGVLASTGFLVMLLLNLYRGPTCTCCVQMPLAAHELPTLKRRRNVEAFLTLLKAQVEKLQGRLSREELSAGLYRLALSTQQPSPLASLSTRTAPVPSRELSSRIHSFAFGCLILDAALAWLSIHHNDLLLTMVNAFTSTVLSVLLITSAVRQWKSSLPVVVKTLLWSGFGVFLSYKLFFWMYIYAIFILGNQVEALRDQWSLFSAVAKLSPHDHPLLVKVMMGYAATALIAGCSGLVTLTMDRWPRKTTGPKLTLNTPKGLHQAR